MADAPQAVCALRDPLVLVVGAERISSRFDEGEYPVERLPVQQRIGARRSDFGEELIRVERVGAGHGHDMLRKDVERPLPPQILVQLARLDRVERRLRFQIFEAVARHDDRFRRFVQTVVCAPDPLQQPRRALGRTHLDDEIDIAPVHAQVERGRRDQPPQPPVRHRRLDFAPRLARQAAVMDADGQRLLVLRPQVLQDQFGEAPRVAEHEAEVVTLDFLHYLPRGIASRMPRPRHAVFGQQDADVGLRARLAEHQPHRLIVAIGRQPAAKAVGIAHRRGQRGTAQPGCQPLQPRHGQRQQVAALRWREGVHLVDDDRLQRRKQPT